jgi:hypothetical protein
LSGILQLKHHKDMWYNGRKFHVKRVDDTKKTTDSRITAVFQVTNVSSRSDKHPRLTENRYYGHLDDIIECDFKSFKIILFEVNWYRLRINERDPERTVIQHDNGFTMVNTKTFEPGLESYVLPSQCEQVFYCEVPDKPGWSFVVRYDPRGMSVKYNVPEEDDIQELEGDTEEHEEVDRVSSDDEVKEVDRPYDVDDNVLDDAISDDDIMENYDSTDDDVDMANPFDDDSEIPDDDT